MINIIWLYIKQEPQGGSVPDIAFVIASGLQLPLQKTKTQKKNIKFSYILLKNSIKIEYMLL